MGPAMRGWRYPRGAAKEARHASGRRPSTEERSVAVAAHQREDWLPLPWPFAGLWSANAQPVERNLHGGCSGCQRRPAWPGPPGEFRGHGHARKRRHGEWGARAPRPLLQRGQRPGVPRDPAGRREQRTRGRSLPRLSGRRTGSKGSASFWSAAQRGSGRVFHRR